MSHRWCWRVSAVRHRCFSARVSFYWNVEPYDWNGGSGNGRVMSYNENVVSYYWNAVVSGVSLMSAYWNCVAGNGIVAVGNEGFVSFFWNGGL